MRYRSEQSFYITGGTLPASADSYVERQADADLFDGLQRDEFCYVLNTRQMGKSSLMIRAAQRLRAAGRQVIVLDLTAVGKNLSVEQWYGGLAVRLAQQTDDRDALLDFWRNHPHLGPMQRLIEALRQVLLASEAGECRKLVIFLDEIDMVRSLPFSVDEFFAGIRECYNRRPSDPVFQNLSFCLLGVATPSDLIHDTRISPFNIGQRIELRDFTPEEAEPLAIGLIPIMPQEAASQSDALYARLNPRGLRLLKRILHWTNGHPYMTQRLCRAVAESLADAGMQSDDDLEDMAVVDRECERFFLNKSARETDDNLAFVRNRLLSSGADTTTVLELYGQVRAGKRVRDDETNPICGILRLSGIVAVERGFLRLRNRVYHQIFDTAWILSHMPDAELRRQRRAYLQGIRRTAAIAAAVLLVVSGLAFQAYRAAQKADEAAQQAHKLEAYSNGLLYASQMQAVQSAYHAHDLMRACVLLDKARDYRERSFEWDYWNRLAHQERFPLPVPEPRSMCVYSRDGKWIVTQTPAAETIPHLDLWDATDGHRIRTIAGRTILLHGVDSPVAADLVAVVNAPEGQTGPALLIDPRTGATLHTLGSAVLEATLSGDGKRVFTLENHRVHTLKNPDTFYSLLKIWDAQQGNLLFAQTLGSLQYLGQLIQQATIQSTLDSRLLAFGGGINRDANRVTLLDTVTHKPSWTPQGAYHFYGLSPQARYLAVPGDPGGKSNPGDQIEMWLWDLQTRQRIVLGGAGRKYTALNFQFSPDERLLAGSGGEAGHRGQVWLWDVQTGRELRPLQDQREVIYESAFSADGKSLFTVSSDTSIRQWNTADGAKGRLYFGSPSVLPALSPANDSIVIGDDTGLRTYSLTAPEPAEQQMLPKGGDIHFLPDSRHVTSFTTLGAMDARGLSAAGTYGVVNYDRETGLTTIAPQPAPLADIPIFSADGSRFLNLRKDVRSGTLCEIRETLTNRLLGRLQGTHPVESAGFSRDGSRIFTQENNRMQIWDAATCREIAQLPSPSYKIQPLEIQMVQNGRKIVCKGDDHRAHMRDGLTGRDLYTFDIGSNSQIQYGANITETPDSRALCSIITEGFGSSKLAVYDIETGRQRFLLQNVLPYLSQNSLSPDGRYLAWGDPRQNAHITELATGKEAGILHYVGGYCTGTAWSPDGRRLLTNTLGGICKLWDWNTGSELMTLPKPDGILWFPRFSPDGTAIQAIVNVRSNAWANYLWDACPRKRP